MKKVVCLGFLKIHKGQISGYRKGSNKVNTKAAEWYEQAATQSHASALEILGEIYETPGI